MVIISHLCRTTIDVSLLQGVLRGERARFQLFGDTMNTAARLESTSHVGRVQLSKETAELLQNAGKDHWFEPRECQGKQSIGSQYGSVSNSIN